MHPYRQPLPAMAAHPTNPPSMVDTINRMLDFSAPARRVVLGTIAYLRLAGEVMRRANAYPPIGQFAAPGLSPIVLYTQHHGPLRCEWDQFAPSDACYPEVYE